MVVEFALLFPVILAVFFAIVQFGFIMFTRQEMLYAAREAARSYSVGLNDAAAARNLALSLLNPNNKDNAIKFAVSVIEPSGSNAGGKNGGKSGGGSGKGKGNGKGSGKSADSGVSGDVTVIITVPIADAALIKFLEESILAGDLEVEATMFVQGVPELIQGSSKGTGKATAKSTGSNKGTGKATGEASFRDYVNGGNHYV